LCRLFHYTAHVAPRLPLGKFIRRKVSVACCVLLRYNRYMSTPHPVEYLRPNEACKRIGVSRNTLNRYLAKGLIRCSRPSLRCTLISTAELARFYTATAQPVPSPVS
jgi:hypothetical protein